MIIHKLILDHLKHHEASESFYWLQAEDAIQWIIRGARNEGLETRGSKRGARNEGLETRGSGFEEGASALDLGCGHGIFGACLEKRGFDVTFSDEGNYLMPALKGRNFVPFNLETEPLEKLGKFDLVICSNVLEHLSNPDRLIATIQDCLTPTGYFFLSWTNWLSPWGGHEFSPFHFFGPNIGVKLFDRVARRKRVHTPFVNLFPTYIGQTLKRIRSNARLKLLQAAPRYYSELGILTRVPILREFATWNCALLIRRNDVQIAKETTIAQQI